MIGIWKRSYRGVFWHAVLHYMFYHKAPSFMTSNPFELKEHYWLGGTRPRNIGILNKPWRDITWNSWWWFVTCDVRRPWVQTIQVSCYISTWFEWNLNSPAPLPMLSMMLYLLVRELESHSMMFVTEYVWRWSFYTTSPPTSKLTQCTSLTTYPNRPSDTFSRWGMYEETCLVSGWEDWAEIHLWHGESSGVAAKVVQDSTELNVPTFHVISLRGLNGFPKPRHPYPGYRWCSNCLCGLETQQKTCCLQVMCGVGTSAPLRPPTSWNKSLWYLPQPLNPTLSLLISHMMVEPLGEFRSGE